MMSERPRPRRETTPSSHMRPPPFLMAAVVMRLGDRKLFSKPPSKLVRDCSLPLALAVTTIKLIETEICVVDLF
ncbi:hypothetical protein Lal_00033735 [Lupinus albus]|nr:hypothetical protein Lal_00033735 [Lupinus albus]